MVRPPNADPYPDPDPYRNPTPDPYPAAQCNTGFDASSLISFSSQS